MEICGSKWKHAKTLFSVPRKYFYGMHQKGLGKAFVVSRLQLTVNPSDVPWEVLFFQSVEGNKARLTTAFFTTVLPNMDTSKLTH